MRERFAQYYYKVDLITLPLQSHSQLALRENQHPHWYHDKGPLTHSRRWRYQCWWTVLHPRPVGYGGKVKIHNNNHNTISLTLSLKMFVWWIDRSSDDLFVRFLAGSNFGVLSPMMKLASSPTGNITANFSIMISTRLSKKKECSKFEEDEEEEEGEEG